MGCPDNPGGPCADLCESGFICDESSSTCVRPSITIWEDAPPGRGARVIIAGGQAITASVDPFSKSVITGAGLRDEPFDYRVLGTVGGTAAPRVALDASPSRVAALWVGDGARYRVAWREATGRHERWSSVRIDPPAGVSYTPTEHFDIDLEDDGAVRIVFRDRNGSLRTARHDQALGVDGWAFETIDDGSATAGGVTCAAREEGAGRGVGFEPDLVIRENGPVVAYYDVDCGDLRLATRGTEAWTVAAVDVGDPLPTAAGGGTARVGRFPSIAWDATDRAHIAYHDASLGRLLLAVSSGDGDWNVEIVDRGVTLDVGSRERKDVVGAFARLTFDDRNLPAITYFDATSTALRIAQRSAADSSWRRRVLASDGAVGFFAHQAFDASVGRVAVAEEIARGESGLESRLRVVWEDAQ